MRDNFETGGILRSSRAGTEPIFPFSFCVRFLFLPVKCIQLSVARAERSQRGKGARSWTAFVEESGFSTSIFLNHHLWVLSE